MTIYQVLCLIGVPALILAVFKYLWSQIKYNTEDSKALKAGEKVLLIRVQQGKKFVVIDRVKGA